MCRFDICGEVSQFPEIKRAILIVLLTFKEDHNILSIKEFRFIHSVLPNHLRLREHMLILKDHAARSPRLLLLDHGSTNTTISLDLNSFLGHQIKSIQDEYVLMFILNNEVINVLTILHK